MKRTLVTLAIVAIAGSAGAQTASTPGKNTGIGTATGGTATMTAPDAAAGATSGAGANANIGNAPAQHPTGAAGTAKKRIERDGYRNVHNLHRGSDGLWHGTAMRGNTEVDVTVDRTGHVSAQ